MQNGNVRLLFPVESIQRIIGGQNLCIFSFVTFRRAVDSSLTGVRYFVNVDMTLIAFKFTVGRTDIFFFINMEGSELAMLFQPHKTGVLMADETTSLIESKTVICCKQGQKT
jgi:hypothetical protein